MARCEASLLFFIVPIVAIVPIGGNLRGASVRRVKGLDELDALGELDLLDLLEILREDEGD